MYDYKFYEYIKQLHSFVEYQNKKINQLEQKINTLEEDIQSLKNKSAIHVDRIEYKFDQLKVESLEGTLNIGLNPSDLQGIEDFTVTGNNQISNNPLTASDRFQSSMRLQEAILQSLETDVKSIIHEHEQATGENIDDSYITFLKDDITKQLPQRIEYYLNLLPKEQRNPDLLMESEAQLIDTIKKDIHKGINVFLNNLPNEMKGRTES
ncbi:spore germination protein GerPC [Bacillus sp. CGMCC 1.16607]|uniref:spore germination protein GerPC n=1 Tax=Bacillus sp. CGMCC 1.16607 TaxID=3351842 RepID=UPI0036253160